MIKQFLFQTLLRTRYHVGFSKNRHWIRKYFWRLESARKFADSLCGKQIVWDKNHKPVYTKREISLSVHEDAKNFSTNI